MSNRTSLSMAIAVLGVILVAGLAVTACGPAPTPVPATVRVTLDEWSIKPSMASVPAGKVTFQVANQGKIEHEMVVLKTDLAANALKPSAADPTKVDEEAGAKNVGEIGEIATGTSKSDTFDLAPGKYVLVCNIAGHYKSGMATAFEVK
ncbi:MAG: copper-binding protein [Chloroflexota bacterium]|nr:copper-binding protein [Chloroflexota bacterium]